MAAPSEKEDNTESGGFIIIGIIVLFIWGGFVSGGQAMLSRTFLPEIAQPTDKKIKEKEEKSQVSEHPIIYT